MWKGSLERDPQVMCKNMLVAGRVLRQACSLTIMPIDRYRDYPPDCTRLSKWRPATGQVGQPLLPPCRASMLDFTWAVNHQRVGAEGQARSVRERRWSIWQCGWFGVRTWSTGFEPVVLPDGSSSFGFRTMIYMFCALAGWWGTIWRASTDRSPAQRRCRESTPRRRSPRPRSASAERSHVLPPAPRSFAPEKAALRAQHF